MIVPQLQISIGSMFYSKPYVEMTQRYQLTDSSLTLIAKLMDVIVMDQLYSTGSRKLKASLQELV